MKSLKFLMFFAVVVFVAGVQGVYAESLAMRICVNNGATCTADIFDNGVGDANGSVGQVTFIGSLMNWQFQVNTGTGSAILGPATLDLNFNATNAVPGSSQQLEIYFTQTQTTPPATGFMMTVGGTLAAGQTVTYTAYTDTVDSFFSTANLINTLSFGASPYAGSITGSAPTDASYTLTQKIVVTQVGALNTGHNQITGDATLHPVPEPATILLLGTGLVALGIKGRRKVAPRV